MGNCSARSASSLRCSEPYGTDEVTLQLLQPVAEQVIQQIEDHLATVSDRHAIQRSLAEAIYELRRTLEELDYWRRHYGR